MRVALMVVLRAVQVLARRYVALYAAQAKKV